MEKRYINPWLPFLHSLWLFLKTVLTFRQVSSGSCYCKHRALWASPCARSGLKCFMLHYSRFQAKCWWGTGRLSPTEGSIKMSQKRFENPFFSKTDGEMFFFSFWRELCALFSKNSPPGLSLACKRFTIARQRGLKKEVVEFPADFWATYGWWLINPYPEHLCFHCGLRWHHWNRRAFGNWVRPRN